ncbi:hypothetical protein [Rhizobium phage RHph_X2_25]|nr:hypothetical protein [Rhizobium phage RHph_X2_25]
MRALQICQGKYTLAAAHAIMAQREERMARKIEKGDHVKLSGEITRVGEDGWVTVHLHGYEYPITIHEDDIEEVIPGPKEPRPRFKKMYDNPPRPKPSNKKRPATD